MKTKYYSQTKRRINDALIGLSQQEAHDYLLWFAYRIEIMYPMVIPLTKEEAVKIIDGILAPTVGV